MEEYIAIKIKFIKSLIDKESQKLSTMIENYFISLLKGKNITCLDCVDFFRCCIIINGNTLQYMTLVKNAETGKDQIDLHFTIPSSGTKLTSLSLEDQFELLEIFTDHSK